MNWCNDNYRMLLMCGDVDVGAVYPPLGRARVWRWRVWVTKSGHPAAGSERSEKRAMEQVDGRFRAFLDAARLIPEGGAA
ncbi:hypothetical protein GGE07_002490 [Sinorhizobium terangae]|nr:hypothetical protein [Sinorhizobium terangae]